MSECVSGGGGDGVCERVVVGAWSAVLQPPTPEII